MINSEKAQGSGGTVLRQAFFCTRARPSVMMSSTTATEAVCVLGLFLVSRTWLHCQLKKKDLLGISFQAFQPPSFFFVKQTQQHLEPHVFHGHLTIKSRCCQSHKNHRSRMYYVEPYVYYYQINYRDNESRFLLPDIINATVYPVYSTQSIDASRF